MNCGNDYGAIFRDFYEASLSFENIGHEELYLHLFVAPKCCSNDFPDGSENFGDTGWHEE